MLRELPLKYRRRGGGGGMLEYFINKILIRISNLLKKTIKNTYFQAMLVCFFNKPWLQYRNGLPTVIDNNKMVEENLKKTLA